MERETTTLTIDKYTFVVKSYATAREMRAIQDKYFSAISVGVNENRPVVSGFDPKEEYPIRLTMVEQLVVSVNGETDNIANRCEDLPSEVFDQLIIKLDDLIAKKKNG